MIVLFPLVVFVLLKALDLPSGVATGLAILAAVPGAPMLKKRTEGAGGEPTYASSLQLSLALCVAIIAPVTLGIFYAQFDMVTERVAPWDVARQVVRVTFLPVLIALVVVRFAPAVVERIKEPLGKIANLLFLLFTLAIVGLLALSPDLRGMLLVGWLPLVAVVITVVAGLAMGHFLGGPAQNTRAVLATASIARNAGLAFYIAALSNYQREFLPILLVYLLTGSVLAIPYSIWSKRRLQSEQ
ncbi:MAG: sodium dependent transporter [Gammaproteobacteria bacterium]